MRGYAFLVLFLFSSVSFADDNDLTNCPLWVAMNSDEAPSLGWSELSTVTHYQADLEHEQFRTVQRFATLYREAYHAAVERNRATMRFDVAEEVAEHEAERALDESIVAEAARRGDNSAEFVARYFGANFGINRRVTGKKIAKLAGVMAIQSYLAQHHYVMTKILVGAAHGATPADVPDAELRRAASAATNVLVRPRTELSYLAKLPRWLDLTAFSVEDGLDGPVAVARARPEEMSGAIATLDEVAAQPGVPHAIRDYAFSYRILRRSVPSLPAHPIIVDLARHAAPLVP